MKQQTDWIGLIIFAMLLFGAIVVSYYLIIGGIHSCTSDPAKYLVNSLTKDKNYTYVELYVYENQGDKYPIVSKIINLRENINVDIKIPDS